MGVRAEWSVLPARIVVALEAWLGAPISRADLQPGGFSPGIAARVTAADGRRVFVKAVSAEQNPGSPGMHRREVEVMSRLPRSAPAPRLLWSLDEGESGWIVLVLENIDGQHPRLPWQDAELDRVLAALARMHRDLTPSPIPVESAVSAFRGQMTGWRRLRDEAPGPLDAWSGRWLDRLVELETEAADAVDGRTLLHMDIRADNILLTAQEVYVVDWPHALVGPAWLDLAFFAPSVAMQGGPDPDELLRRSPAPIDPDPDALTRAVVAIAGWFVHRSLLPPSRGLPTVRRFQAAQGEIARRWVAARTGWT